MLVKKPNTLHFTILHWLSALILGPISVIFACGAIAILAFVYLPFFYIFFSANNGLRKKDMAVVQLYLDHFHRLYPDLVNAVAAWSDPGVTRLREMNIKFWPNEHERDFFCIPLVAIWVTTHYTFSAPAGLFATFEGMGFPRPALWEFLRDTVERSLEVSEQEKQEFRRIMRKMCTGMMAPILRCIFAPVVWAFIGFWSKTVEYIVPGTSLTLDNSPNVGVRKGTIDWVLLRGATLIPLDRESEGRLRNLSDQVWGKIKHTQDLNGHVGRHWQMVDLRQVRWPTGRNRH